LIQGEIGTAAVVSPPAVELLLLPGCGSGDIDQIIATFAQTVAERLHCPGLGFVWWVSIRFLRHPGQNGVLHVDIAEINQFCWSGDSLFSRSHTHAHILVIFYQ